MSDNINIRIGEKNKIKIKEICKTEKTTLSDVIREYIDLLVVSGTTKITLTSSENDFKYLLDNIVEDNNKIINLLKLQLEKKDSQIEEKDNQLKSKDKLIENMQVLMKDNQQLLKDEQNKNILLLDNKNNKNNTSWFSFFKNKNV